MVMMGLFVEHPATARALDPYRSRHHDRVVQPAIVVK